MKINQAQPQLKPFILKYFYLFKTREEKKFNNLNDNNANHYCNYNINLTLNNQTTTTRALFVYNKTDFDREREREKEAENYCLINKTVIVCKFDLIWFLVSELCWAAEAAVYDFE